MIVWHPTRYLSAGLALAALLAGSSSATAGLILTTGNSNAATQKYNFGPVLVGQSSQVTVNAKNTAATPLTAVTLPGLTGDFNTGSNPNAVVTSSLGGGQTMNRIYQFTPGQRGTESQAITATATNGKNSLHASMTFSGQGVAPVQSVTTTGAGLTRIGTVGQGSITITNIGDGNLSHLGALSNLNGIIPAQAPGAAFSLGSQAPFSLTDRASKTFSYAFVPTDHGAASDSTTIAFSNGNNNGRNTAQNVQVTLSGQGVGPTFQSSLAPGSLLDFGHVASHDKTLSLQISNISVDPNGGNHTLTDLSITKATITGTNIAGLSVNLNGGSSQGLVLGEGSSDSVSVTLGRHGPYGARDGLLTLYTDEGAAFGGHGQTFTYQLHGMVTPEPASITLAGLGIAGVCLGGWYRRRKS